MNQTELISHVEWSLDLTSPIELMEMEFKEDFNTDYLVINNERIFAQKYYFKEITPEGYISTWYRDYPLTKGNYILVIWEHFRKDFTTGEENKSTTNQLYSL